LIRLIIDKAITIFESSNTCASFVIKSNNDLFKIYNLVTSQIYDLIEFCMVTLNSHVRSCWNPAVVWAKWTNRLALLWVMEEKVQITSLNFRESPLFLPELSNRTKHLPQLLKPFILPPWPCYKQFWRRFYFFLFYLFQLNL
jgi:hypothetical protein